MTFYILRTYNSYFIFLYFLFTTFFHIWRYFKIEYTKEDVMVSSFIVQISQKNGLKLRF